MIPQSEYEKVDQKHRDCIFQQLFVKIMLKLKSERYMVFNCKNNKFAGELEKKAITNKQLSTLTKIPFLKMALMPNS